MPAELAGASGDDTFPRMSQRMEKVVRARSALGTAGPAVSAGAPDRRRGGQRQPKAAVGSLLPYLVVLACCGAGLAWMWASRSGIHGVRGGTLAVAGAMSIAALARLVLPEGRAGMLASRKRATDVITLAALAVGLLAVGLQL